MKEPAPFPREILYRSLNATVAQSKNYSFAVDTTIELKKYNS